MMMTVEEGRHGGVFACKEKWERWKRDEMAYALTDKIFSGGEVNIEILT